MSATATATAVASASASAAAASAQPASFKIIGVVLAVGSGFFIGTSFVIKKKGLLDSASKSGDAHAEGHAYLKSWVWWLGMILMIIGEILNFVAYAFTEAILVTPLGALSVVICAILSAIFLKETLTFFGKIGCLLAILGATIVALNGPDEATVSEITEFQKLFFAPGFLVYAGVVIVASAGLVIWDRRTGVGKRNMMVYIGICSLIGGLSVACTQGLGAAILYSIRGHNQFKHWFIYFLMAFVVVTLLTEINYLNKALQLFNTASVSPSYYCTFTGATLVTSVILYQGLKSTASEIITVVMGFFVICSGVILLQLSKVDPVEVSHQLDRSSTVLLAATRANDASQADYEKTPVLEGPAGMGVADAVGTLGRALSVRMSARRGSTASSQHEVGRVRRGAPGAMGSGGSMHGTPMSAMRHQLYDNPMPYDAADKVSLHSSLASPSIVSPRGRSDSALRFATVDTTHIYNPHSQRGDSSAQHGTREPGRSRMGSMVSPTQVDIGTFQGISPAPSNGTFDSVAVHPSDTPRPSESLASGSGLSGKYRDPYDLTHSDSVAEPEEFISPRQTQPSTFPRNAGVANGLAEQLRQEFAQSNPSFQSGPETPVSPLSGGHRFKMPFRSSSKEREPRDRASSNSSQRRIPIPSHGVADPEMERQESESLVQSARLDQLMAEEEERATDESFATLESVESGGTYRPRNSLE